MKKWAVFEVEATEYLNKNFGDVAFFEHCGESNSTIPDIKVITKSNNSYYIEAKLCPAQSGQFVLLPNLARKQFDYSDKNVTQLNKYSIEIINHMNKNYDLFKNSGTKGIIIDFPNSEMIFSSWILSTYINKKIRFVITNNFNMLPISDFPKAFHISAKYRVKKSGSSSVGKSSFENVINYLRDYLKIYSYTTMDDKLFINAYESINNPKFTINGEEYYFTRKTGNFEVRKLSKTFNANVIFTITPKMNYTYLSANQFRKLL